MWPMHQPEGDDELPLLDMRMWAAGGSLIDFYGRLTSKLGLNALLKAASEREQGSD